MDNDKMKVIWDGSIKENFCLVAVVCEMNLDPLLPLAKIWIIHYIPSLLYITVH